MASKVLYITAGDSTTGGTSGSSTTSGAQTDMSISIPDASYSVFSTSLTPKTKSVKKITDYTINYNNLKMPDIDTLMRKVDKSVGLTPDNAANTFNKTMNYYNRFKQPTLNDVLQRGFAHVFFVRPNCNVLDTSTVTQPSLALSNTLKNNPVFNYALKNSPNILRELELNTGRDNDFMLSLSNKASSFSLSDEYINSDTYGKTYTGYKIAYGKNNIESKSAGSFTVSYDDDKSLHIYLLHKLWVEYINGCYRGIMSPTYYNILNKIIDYAGACYYFLTAEDGETIIFWSKYYGVFPTTIPSTQYSWAKNNVLKMPTIDIQYQYSFKEDYNPAAIIEFNRNARIYDESSLKYEKTYNNALGHVGPTWVGAPFIELVTNETNAPYTFKLRFKQKD